MNEAPKTPKFTLAHIAEQLGGAIVGEASTLITGFASADTARPGDLAFAESQAYLERAEKSAASAVLVAGQLKSATKTLIHVPNARVAFAKILPLFFPEPNFTPSVHRLADVHSTAQVDPTAHIGPFCVVGERVKVGAHAVLEGGNHIGADSQIGEGTRLFPNVTLYPRSIVGSRVRIHAGTVIGSDGFGYVFDQGSHRKVPQVGNVIIHDDVEIGANVAIDRAALGSTVIGKGTKIDNLVQVAHNVVIGEHSIVIAQVGIAGSTKVGKHVTIAGQAGVAGHLEIGNHAIIAGQAGVMNDIPDGEKWLGSPARLDRQVKRQFIALEHLPELLQRVRALERQFEKHDGAQT